jgi:hypothetical protein
MTGQADKVIFAIPIKSAGVIVANRFVGFDGNQATVQGQACLGVAEYGVDAAHVGLMVPCARLGSKQVEAGGVLAAGNPVITDSQGRAIAATGPLAIAAGATAVTSSAANGAILTGSTPPESVLGQVAPGSSSSGAGQYVEILLG